MNKIYILLLTILAASIATFSHPQTGTKPGHKVVFNGDPLTSGDFYLPYNLKEPIIGKLEIPRAKPNEYVINHAAYSLSYNAIPVSFL